MNVLSDRAVAWIRTVVPGAWAALVAVLVVKFPALQPVAGSLGGFGGVIVLAAALALWKLVFGWLEPRLPSWLTTVLLGYPVSATYVKVSK